MKQQSERRHLEAARCRLRGRGGAGRRGGDRAPPFRYSAPAWRAGGEDSAWRTEKRRERKGEKRRKKKRGGEGKKKAAAPCGRRGAPLLPPTATRRRRFAPSTKPGPKESLFQPQLSSSPLGKRPRCACIRQTARPPPAAQRAEGRRGSQRSGAVRAFMWGFLWK